MNGTQKIPTQVLLIFILSCLIFSLLLPSLIVSISQQTESSMKAQYLSTEIHDLQEYKNEMAYHPPTEVKPAKGQTILTTLKAEYRQLKIDNILGMAGIAVKTFLTWLVVVLATRIFNDYFYPPIQSWVQKSWKRSKNKTTK